MNAPRTNYATRAISTALLAAAAASPIFAQLGDGSVRFNVQFLPLGGAMQSRAECGAFVGDLDHYVIGGSVNAGGGWNPCVWRRDPAGLSQPVPLSAAGVAGRVSSITVDPSDPRVIYLGGAVQSSPGGVARATLWQINTDPASFAELTVTERSLPTPTGTLSSVTDLVIDPFNASGEAGVIVVGRFTVGGLNRAAMWIGPDDHGNFLFRSLHAETGAVQSEALAVDTNAEGRTVIAGNMIGTDGTTWPARWIVDGTSNTIMYSEMDVPSYSATAVVGDWNGDGRDTIGLSAQGRAGSQPPALASLAGDELVEFESLTLPPGHTGGTVNGIIAILIGLLVPGHTTGPAGQSACIWINQPEIPSNVIDLNAAARNLPLGTRLTTVRAMEPPTEEVGFVFHNITWFGASIGAAGRERAYIAKSIRQFDGVGQLGGRD